jgi:hypothetical protein
MPIETELAQEHRYCTAMERLRGVIQRMHPALARRIDLDSLETLTHTLERVHAGLRVEVVSAQRHARQVLDLAGADVTGPQAADSLDLSEGIEDPDHTGATAAQPSGASDPAAPAGPAELDSTAAPLVLKTKNKPPVSKPGRQRGWRPKPDPEDAA